MSSERQIEQTARAGADSVFGYVERTAEAVPDGVRWRTLTYENEPQYDLSIFNGVGGIPLFLGHYHRLTGNERARELAEGAMRWCSQPERMHEGSAEEWRQESLLRGRAGIGMGWLRLAQATGDRDLLVHAAAVGDHLAALEPGPVTDFIDGVAGQGVFLVRLAEETGNDAHLAGAVRRGEWFAGTAVRDERGCYWPWEVGSTEFADYLGLSFPAGLAGIGYFLLLLHQATGEGRWAELAREAGDTLVRYARPDRGGLNWPDTMDEQELRCQWCNGAPGVGLFFVKGHEALGDPSYLETAEAAGETTFAYGDVRRNAVQCHGLAGQGELLIELYRATGKQEWLERAHELARLAFAYREQRPEGEVWRADDPGYYSPDFMCGASGTGHFFLRLWQPDRVRPQLL